MLAMNDQILRHTEYKNTSTEPPQILLSDLRFYCPTSEFTVRPQNLQYDLRIYSTTSEFTVRPQNLQYDLRIYSTTSEFYCPTWVFGSSNFSTTWPGGSVLLQCTAYLTNFTRHCKVLNTCIAILHACWVEDHIKCDRIYVPGKLSTVARLKTYLVLQS